MGFELEHYARAAERVDDAVAALRARAGAGAEALEYYGDLDSERERVRSWIRGPATNKEWSHQCRTPTYGLLLAQSWRLAFPDEAAPSFPDSARSTATGWLVERTTVWFGDTHVPGDLELAAPLIVLGALTVDGRLDDGDVHYSLLGVAGDLRARVIRSGAWHLVLGSITADVISCFNNDGSLVAGGDIVADLFAPAEHAFDHQGELRVRVFGGDTNEVEAEDLAPWLPDGYVRFGADEPVDIQRILAEATAGRSPVLDQPRPLVFPTPAPLLAAVNAPSGLTRLDLSRQRVHALPDGFATLTDLTRLDLSDTPLRSLAGLAGVRSLQWLSISHTPVRSLTPLTALPRLAHLDISYCTDVTDWSDLLRLPALEQLVGYGCPLPAEVRAELGRRLGARNVVGVA